MTPTTEAWLARLKPTEGGYTNDPADPGGETNFGVTKFVARAFGYQGDMRAMTWDAAKPIYEQRFIVQPGFDKLVALDAALAWKLFDIGVNMGQPVGGKFLQRALNALNNQQADYPDLTVDGNCGAMTRAALAAFYAKRGPDGRKVMNWAVGAEQGVRYLEIVESNPLSEKYTFGWLLQRAMAVATG